MDARDYIRPIIAGLVGLAFIVLIIILFVKLLGGHGGTPQKLTDLDKYANTAATVTLLADGPTNVDQDHRQVKITVTQNETDIDILQGYEGTVIDSRTYASNSVAFGTFLASLKQLNFAKGDTNPADQDYRGYCPTGERYVFTFNDGQTDKFTYWATSCGQGTYGGKRAPTLDLFRQQIPQKDFGQLTNSLQIGF